MTDTSTATRILLDSRPVGWPTPENFRIEEVALPELEAGQVRVRNEFLSVDPYMRGRMSDARSYVAPYALGAQITGGAIGRVVASRVDGMPEGSVVLHQHGWSDVVQGDAATFRIVPDIPGLPLSVRLHVLGMTGMTAYVGLTRIAALREGETVFISGAAGAVGTAAGQIARHLGAGRVIGSAGTPEKVALLTQKYGYDAGFDYHDGDVRELLAQAAPEGIDVFFDNVGGDHLQAALASFRDGGRAALCGAISSYNTTDRAAGPDNMANLITRGLTLRGFTLGDHLDLSAEFQQRMTGWFEDGGIVYDETIVDGIENTVQAFLDMMRGGNIGKMLVRI
ncbi:NADP-dependent oxidoreductase [Brachybacterium phenoliresistens]|uniref:NADP-dependent oxidoreductase n=1 Tax=Brachybacterium phenoliresistens TaxID=396014 RepID=Z9JPK6_9MICO|nr:NADP-dependent oxidoreductase [Brachybacterium phenoliresistens]EWS79731.1 NADP-dependent oxidoreductase [Brachybacterium phenoliresistens]